MSAGSDALGEGARRESCVLSPESDKDVSSLARRDSDFLIMT